jgi:hypothetical protein
MKAELVGGPLDGTIITKPSGVSLLWVSATKSNSTATPQNADEYSLYRAVPKIREGISVWLWSGDVLAPCSCGTLHSRRDDSGNVLTTCTLCGTALA